MCVCARESEGEQERENTGNRCCVSDIQVANTDVYIRSFVFAHCLGHVWKPTVPRHCGVLIGGPPHTRGSLHQSTGQCSRFELHIKRAEP